MSAPISQTQWYLARNNQQHGPITDAELAKFIKDGHLLPDDLLWREGFANWQPASVVFAQAMAWLIGERPARRQILGALLVAAGAVLLGWP